MINIEEVIETNRMIEEEKLDVRTITIHAVIETPRRTTDERGWSAAFKACASSYGSIV